MAIKVSGTDVITNARQLANIASIDSATATAITNAGVGGAASAFRLLTSAPGSPSTGDCYYNQNDYNLYIYDGSAFVAKSFAAIQLNTYSGDQIYSGTASGNWSPPNGVFKVSVVCIGSGGRNNPNYNGGHGGGGLCWKNFQVLGGQTYAYATGTKGSTQNSTFTGHGVQMVANYGVSGSSTAGNAGGAFSGGDGGGYGGNGGSGHGGGNPGYGGGGGGGAGGYNGAGGAGGSTNNTGTGASVGSAGAGGGGGGGGGGFDAQPGRGAAYGNPGGGTQIYGQAGNGAGGGSGGSSVQGTAGGIGSVVSGTPSGVTAFGAGQTGGYYQNLTQNGEGAIRICWKAGSINAFPNTNVGP